MIQDIFDFLRELRDNNNRDWFNSHKPEYLKLKSEFELFVGRLIEELGCFDEEVRGLAVKDCVYRIYRDTRFSSDKTPYKTHFAAYIAAFRGRNSNRAGYYLHLQPDGSLLGGGLYCPEPALLKRVRQDIFDNIDEFTSILRDPEFCGEFPELDPMDRLKKVPAPFPSDFPEADLLKYKHYDVVSYKPDCFFTSEQAMADIVTVFKKLYPFNRFLNYTVDEMNA